MVYIRLQKLNINDCLQFCSKIPGRGRVQCSTIAGLRIGEGEGFVKKSGQNWTHNIEEEKHTGLEGVEIFFESTRVKTSGD